jgi:polyhydroxybutyrate depolymerase
MRIALSGIENAFGPGIGKALGRIAVVLGLALAGCSDPESVKPSSFDYESQAAGWPRCDSPMQAVEGSPPEIETEAGARVVIKTPTNYRPDLAHPLIVLFAPGGGSSESSERHHGITKEATSQGFIVAAVEDRRPNFETIKDLATIPALVAKNWCIDEERIFATGHSNGGLYSNAMAFYPDARGSFRAIAPSAAGIRKQDLEQYSCPKPTPVMIYHGSRDIAFEGFGRSAAEWWAKCNGCEGEKPLTSQEGCVQFQGCNPGGITIYCEGPWFHGTWPGRNSEILEFFRQNGEITEFTQAPAATQ